MHEVVIESEGDAWVTPGMIAALAQRHDWPSHGIRVPESRTRDAGASIVVALVGVGGAALGALIKGLIDLSISRIRIEFDDAGVKSVEIPRDIKAEELDERLAALSKHRAKKIVLGA
jgi:hypothetical protein